MSASATWIDSHAHLTMFEPDEVPGVLERALEAGVAGVLVPATNGDDLDLALRLAADFDGSIVAAAGVHPHDASSLDRALKRRIEEALDAPGVVAVGEVGLDYHYMNSPREDQLSALRWQLDLAVASGLPVVLHNRESWHDLEAELSRREGDLRGVCHSFAEGPDQALRVVELGLVIGISGMVTFKAADNIRQMVAALPPERVMVETDSPFLAPVPHRGRTNEPAYVVAVGHRLGEEWGRAAGEVAAVSSSCFGELFSVSEGWGSAA